MFLLANTNQSIKNLSKNNISFDQELLNTKSLIQDKTQISKNKAKTT